MAALAFQSTIVGRACTTVWNTGIERSLWMAIVLAEAIARSLRPALGGGTRAKLANNRRGWSTSLHNPRVVAIAHNPRWQVFPKYKVESGRIPSALQNHTRHGSIGLRGVNGYGRNETGEAMAVKCEKRSQRPGEKLVSCQSKRHSTSSDYVHRLVNLCAKLHWKDRPEPPLRRLAYEGMDIQRKTSPSCK